MSQHDYSLANQSGADFRADLNNALSAIATVNSGASEPSTSFAHQLWVDTSNNVLKIRNAANSAFITTGISITASNTFAGNLTGNVTGDLTGNADTATTLATARTINGTSFDGSANISFNTDSVAEGSSNLYFTNERVDDQVNALLQAGTGIQLTYDDTAGTLTIANTNDADITGVVAGNGLTGGGTSGSVTLNVAVDDSSIEIDSDALRVKASGITNTMLAGSIANSKLANSGVTINSQSLSLGGTLVLDTDNIGEGSSNLYYTDTRTNSAIDARVTNTFINNLSGVVADTSTALATARTIALSGDVVGSVSFDGTADVTIASTIQANSVALGTDTTGNYIQTITGTANKITVSGSGSESADVTLTLPDNVQVANDLTVAGNLTVNGTLTSLDTTNLDIEDNLFQLNAGLTGSPVNDSGMLINRGNQNNGIFMWDESVDKFTLGLTTADGTSTGNITLASLGTLVANVEGNVTGTIQTAAQPNITSLGTLTGLTTTGDINFGDNDKAVFGAGSDLEIYHDGSNSFVKDAGTGTLRILSDDVRIMNAAGTEISAQFLQDGEARLKYDNSTKLATKSTGINVTGIVENDGLRVDNTDSIRPTTDTSLITISGGNATNSGANYTAFGGTHATLPNIHRWRIGGSEAGRFDSSGQLLIGKTASDNTTVGTRINGSGFISSVVDGDNAVLLNRLNSDGSIVLFRKDGTTVGSIGAESSKLNIGNGDTGIEFNAVQNAIIPHNQTSNANVDNSIDLGFPSLRFKDLYLSGTATMDGLTVNSGTTNTVATFTSTDAGAGIQLTDSTGSSKLETSGANLRISVDDDGAVASSAIQFRVDGSTKATLNSSGNLGLGTTSPTGKIHVISGSTPSIAQLIIGYNNTSINYFDANTHIFRNGSSQETMRLDSSGNLGLGTTSPQNNLHVNAGTGGGVTLEANANVDIDFRYRSGGVNKYNVAYDASAGSLIWYDNTANATRMTLDSSGNLGLGTSTPTLGGFGTAANGLEIADATLAGIRLNGNASDSMYFISGSGKHWLYGKGAVPMTFSTNGTEALRIDSNQNVGIGTTSPTGDGTALHIHGSTHSTLHLTNSTTGSAVSDGFDIITDGSDALLRNREDAAIKFRIGSSEVLRMNSTGVGIGTTSPDAPLTVHSSSDPEIRLGYSSTQDHRITWDSAKLFIDADPDNGVGNSALGFRVDGSEAGRFDASGNFYVGTTDTTLYSATSGGGIYAVPNGSTTIARQSTSSTQPLFILNETGVDGTLQEFRKDGTTVGAINTVSDDLAILSSISGHKGLRFGSGAITPTTNTAAIDNGNTDLGGNSIRFKDLYLGGTANVNKVSVDGSGANGIDLEADSSATTNSNRLFFSTSAGSNSIMSVSGALTFRTGATAGSASGTERLRLDSSGNFMVGKTSVAVSTTGSEIRSDGQVSIVREGDTPLFINRKTDDGTVIDLRKDNSTVGKIGTNTGDIFLGTGDTFLRFNDSLDSVLPATATGAGRDNATDLGYSGGRFKDIYATNGTIQTSDINEKQDIEDLTDAETRVAVAAKSLLKKYRWKSAVEEKGDDARIHFGIMAQDLQNAFTAEGLDAGDYGMFISTTWTDDDGVEQTRLGVRYSELLAFIIAVI